MLYERQMQIIFVFLLIWSATEVVAARGRLKGALQDIANITEDESEIDSSKPSRGRPPKRVKKETTPPPQQPKVQHSFIMKLFDRCVDLAKYSEHTPLYPICRAWMMNQPKSNQIIKYDSIYNEQQTKIILIDYLWFFFLLHIASSYKMKKEVDMVERKSNDTLLDDLKNAKISEVTEMPPINEAEISRIPTPMFQLNNAKATLDLDYVGFWTIPNFHSIIIERLINFILLLLIRTPKILNTIAKNYWHR